MNVYTDISTIGRIEKPILTIGTFDGVHQGHRMIIDRINELAKEKNGHSVLLTFHPHPRSVVNSSRPMVLINTLEEKLALLDEAGLDHVIVLPFTKSFSRISALEYVRDLLVNAIGVHHLVVGYDHHFGRNREGDIKILKEYSELLDFSLEEIPAQTIDEVNISSTKIRRAIEDGDVSRAKEFLGYPYFFSGTVVHGEAIGRTIGYPTANIIPDDQEKLIPGHGVYAVIVSGEGWRKKGMANIGVRPTLNDLIENTRIEVHLLNHSTDLYGQELKVEFHSRIREEQKFPSLDELREQLDRDRDDVMSALKDFN